MAVEAQHSFNANCAFPSAIRITPNVIEDQQLIDNPTGLRSRKRSRDDDDDDVKQYFPSNIQSIIPYYYHQHNPLMASATASTIGRQHLTEIDALLQLHNSKVRSEVAEIQRRHCLQFRQAYQNHATNRIAEKDAEIQRLKSRQAELEAALKQAMAENQTWFTVASNSESLVNGLKFNLDQVLRQNAGQCHVERAQVDDTESCCYEGDSDGRRKVRGLCKVCGERNISILVLPCRHLCLCSECQPVTDTCPICYGVKSIGLQVFLG